MEIHSFDVKDIDEVAKLYLKSYKNLEEYSYTHEEDVKVYINWLLRRDVAGLFVVKDGDKIVGFMAIDGNWYSKKYNKVVGAIHEIFVDSDYFNKGVGSMLMEKAIEYFKQRNLDLIELWVGDKNEKAMKFYEKFGFRKDGQYNFWVRMVKDI
ncbi:GCN5-related N-acetyltransferase [Hydrogenobaculum sp. Y04AAS1]|uniref:GNAT family N-acetyltransferase n=1 Tax=Hydrogenobaculum sp. (strain Y04AAS1) TaxID=380749 RepID=UPI00015BCAFD|nr:GCN5-related N-acetyltransferase [Hydrogenobaculum sp. Y04AAS1]HCT65910.1 N-acetyltransferase [Hydrogenobaculum sp.]